MREPLPRLHEVLDPSPSSCDGRGSVYVQIGRLVNGVPEDWAEHPCPGCPACDERHERMFAAAAIREGGQS